MANFSGILCILGLLVIIIPAILGDYTHEKHIIHVPVFIHHIHHHHILKKKNKVKPRKKWKRMRTRIIPGNYIRHYHSAHTWYP